MLEFELFRISFKRWAQIHQRKKEQKEPIIHYLRPLVRYFLNSRTIFEKLQAIKDKQPYFSRQRSALE